MVLPWDVCYVVQFNWLHRDLFEMCNLYGVLSLASTGNDVILRHCTCFQPFHDRRGALVVCIKFACLSCHSFRSFYMVDGGKSCFRSSERKVVSTPPLRADFTQQSSPRSSHGPLRKTNLCQAFLQQEVSHRFKTHYLLLAVWHWDSFQLKQFETQSPLWQRLNRSFGGNNICEPLWWGRIIYSLALRHTFSVQLPFVRHASSKAVVSRKRMCTYRLTIRSITQQPKGKQYRNREPSRVQVNKVMQKLRKWKVREHLKVFPRKVFQNRQAGH